MEENELRPGTRAHISYYKGESELERACNALAYWANNNKTRMKRKMVRDIHKMLFKQLATAHPKLAEDLMSEWKQPTHSEPFIANVIRTMPKVFKALGFQENWDF